MAGITLTNVTKRFPGFMAVRDLNLTIGDGEFLVLVGPSGCGKTTLLRMIAGLEPVTVGPGVFIGDRDVTAMPPKHRDIAMVFQDYALYPHLTVEQNLGIGLKLRRVPKAERASRVRQGRGRSWASKTLLKRKPAELSGGQQQRVAIGRAMVREPRSTCSMSRSRTSTPSCASKRAQSWRVCATVSASRPSTSPTIRSRR